jgi:hypothetical protein
MIRVNMFLICSECLCESATRPKAKLAAAEIDREAVCLPAGRRASKDSQVT